LSDEAASGVDAIWESVKGDAPVDNFNQGRSYAQL
jgi:hypothetical protein